MNVENRAFSSKLSKGLGLCAIAWVFSGWNPVLGQETTDLGQQGTTPNEVAVGDAVQMACGTGENGESANASSQLFQSDCNAMVGAVPSSDLAGALSDLTTDEIAAINTNMITSSINAVYGRLSSIRLAHSGSPPRQFAGLGSIPRGGAAGSDEIFSRLGFFINGSYSWQDHNDNTFEPGFELEERKIIAGTDYRFTDDLILGVSAGWVDSDADIDSDGGNIETAGYNVALYGSFYVTDQFYIDAVGGYGDRSHDIHRRISYTLPSGVVNNRANSDPDSDNYFASLGTGYQFNIGAITVSPILRVDYTRLELDSYTERMSNPGAPGGSWNLRVKAEDFETLTSNFGVQTSYAWSQPWGVVVPRISGEWVHEFKDSAESVDAAFVNDVSGLAAFTVQTDSPDRNWFNFRIGASAQFAQGIAAFVNYEKIFGLTDVESDTLFLGIRMELH